MPLSLVRDGSTICQVCFERFFESAELKRHYESSHTDESTGLKPDCYSDNESEGQIEDGTVNAIPGIGYGYGVSENEDDDKDYEVADLLKVIACSCGCEGDDGSFGRNSGACSGQDSSEEIR